ncbi:MAG: class I SAM-dependent methyltransferase [Candidatus Nealsonbacteria bacterium]
METKIFNDKKINTRNIVEKLYHNKYAFIYDYFQKGVKGDVKFYINYFKNFKGKILEIGAGTGRITIPLLEKGADVTALDISSNMLKILEEKAEKKNIKTKTICADMRNFKLRDKFEAIIITYRSFQHLYTVDNQIKTLKNIKKYLKPNGVLIFDVYKPSLKFIGKGNWKWQKDSIIKLPGIKGKIKINFRNRYDMAEQMMSGQYKLIYPNGKKEILPLKMRFFFRFEIEHLLKLAGFKVKNLYGDFYKNKFNNKSTEMIWEVNLIQSSSKKT